MSLEDERAETVDEDVPVYESLYPELEKMCSHPNCEQESPPGERICDDCTLVMDDNSKRSCDYCGDFLRQTPDK